jgi:hypothetical protein
MEGLMVEMYNYLPIITAQARWLELTVSNHC